MASTEAALLSSLHSVEEGFRQDYLKIAFLWHDAILFEEVGRYTVSQLLEGITEGEALNTSQRASLSDVVVPLSTFVEKDVLDVLVKSKAVGYPRWGKDLEHYDYPEPEDAYQFAHNELLRSIEREFGVDRFEGYDIEQTEGRSRIAVDIIQLWNLVNSICPCLLLANSDEEKAMNAAMSFGIKAADVPASIELFEASIPSMTSVPWSKIIDVKSKGAFDELRKKIQVVFEKGGQNIAAGTLLLQDTEQQVIDEIVEAHRPKLISTSIKNIAANIPGLLINPVGAYVGAKEIFDEARKARNLGWFYALRDIRDLPKK